MIIKILILILVLVAIFALATSMQSPDFRVTRSMSMNAPLSLIFDQVNNLRNWEAWSPWAKLDPDAITTFEGPEAGVGAAMRWSGNRKIGEGTMTITESRPGELIRMRLDFVRPFNSTSFSEFTFTPEGGQVLVVWSMWGTNNFIGKAMSLVMNCDKMMGDQFKLGLKQLKASVQG